MKKLILPLVILILYGCDPRVLFDAPQPAFKKDLTGFPDRLQGSYFQLGDSSIFIIDRDLIREKNILDLSEPLDSILVEEDCILTDDSLYIEELGGFPVEIRNDSIFGTFISLDTMFHISKEHILRKYRKYYYLNMQRDTNWIVYKLRINPAGISTFCTLRLEEAEKIREYMDVEVILDKDNNPAKYILKPGNKGFKRLLREGCFTDCDSFVRLN